MWKLVAPGLFAVGAVLFGTGLYLKYVKHHNGPLVDGGTYKIVPAYGWVVERRGKDDVWISHNPVYDSYPKNKSSLWSMVMPLLLNDYSSNARRY